MNDTHRVATIEKFFAFDDFKLFANALPNGIIAMNKEGRISFANKMAQSITFEHEQRITPFIDYQEVIRKDNVALLNLISDTLRFEKNLKRQIEIERNTYLIESYVVCDKSKCIGCMISISNISGHALREKQHELLYQISSALSGVSSINQVLKIAVGQIVRSVQATSANIMLLDHKTNMLRIKVDSNGPLSDHPLREFKIGEGLAGKAALERHPFSAYDVANCDDFCQRVESDHGALLVIPLVVKEKLLGVLNVCDKTPRYFTENEVQFLTILANEVAISLENSQLYEKLNRKIQLLTKLFWLSSFIGTQNIDSRIQRFVKLVPDLLEAEDCCVYIYAPGTTKLILKYQKNVSAPLPLQIDLRKPSLTSTIFTDQKSITINQPDTPAQEFSKYKIRNMISAPILANEKPIGVIHAFNKYSGNFDEEDRNLLTISALRISTKIENAQLIRKVEAEKELLDKIIANTSEGVVVLNRKRKIILWNDFIEDMTGLKGKDFIGQPCYRIFYNKLGLKKLTQHIYSSFEPGQKNETHYAEVELKNKHGDKRWVCTITSQIVDLHKNMENIIILFRDISQEHELISAKNEFVSMTTHELRTPLTAIKGYLSMIINGDSGELSGKQREYFLKAYNSTERLVNLVEDLLEVVRIEENQINFNFDTININEVIRDTVDGLSQAAAAKSIHLDYTSQSPLRVRADLNKTKEILENLIDNAIKYTRTKGSILITSEKRERDVLISIKDNGVGIPAKHLNSIFERFVRVPNSLSVKAGGTGLGLYIVKNLIEKQGGTIGVKSQVGKETTFYFTLPLVMSPVTRQKVREE